MSPMCSQAITPCIIRLDESPTQGKYERPRTHLGLITCEIEIGSPPQEDAGCWENNQDIQFTH